MQLTRLINTCSRAGFTLLEVVIASTIMIGIMMTIVTALDSGTKATEALNTRASVVNKATDVVNALSLELRYASMSTFIATPSATEDRYTYSVWTKDSITKEGLVQTGEYARELVYDKTAKTLTEYFWDPTNVAGKYSVVLATGVSTFAITQDVGDASCLLAVELKVEQQTATSTAETLAWDSKQSTVYMRSKLSLGDGYTGLNTDADPNNDPTDHPTITSSESATGTDGVYFSYQIEATENPTKYGVTGTFPHGVSYSSTTGLISGTPNASGQPPYIYNLVLFAKNAAGYGTKDFTLTLNSSVASNDSLAPVITGGSATGVKRAAFSYQIQATYMTNKYGPGGYVATGLPGGLGIDPDTGIISGTPSASGTFTVALSASNKYGTGSGSLTLTIAEPSNNPPVVTGGSVTGTKSSSFSYQIVATNMTTTYAPSGYTASGLPSGLSVNASTGLISGTPHLEGSSTVTLTATNADGTGSSTLSITINIASGQEEPVVSGGSVSGTQRVPFSYSMSATYTGNSYKPVSYAASGLPAGIGINASTGVISGTPTTNGSFTVTLAVTNANGTGTNTLAMTIAPPTVAPPVVSAGSVPGDINVAYSYQITATNMTSVYGPVGYSATGLPTGLSIDTATGLISGTPTVAGTYTVTIGATNADGTGTSTLTIYIPSVVPVVSGGTATGKVGTAFSYTITATLMANKDHPVGYSASGLPSGLTVAASSGTISGTPGSAGTYTVTISATNQNGTGTSTLTITVSPMDPPVVGSNSTTATLGTAFGYQIVATNSPTSYAASGLPAGLSLNTGTGRISGTPTAQGSYSATISATNAGGTGSNTLAITVNAAPATPSITFQPTKTTAPASGGKVKIDGSRIRIIPPSGYTVSTIVVTRSTNQISYTRINGTDGVVDEAFSGNVAGGAYVYVTVTVTKSGTTSITNTSPTITF